MKLEKLSALAELVSSIAVLVTLVYLAVQTNQNTRAVQASVRQAMIEEDREILFAQMDRPFLDLVTIDGKELTPDEMFQTRAWLTAFYRTRESFWLHYRAGVIDETTWASYHQTLLRILQSSRIARDVWDFLVDRGDFTRAFVDEVNRTVGATTP